MGRRHLVVLSIFDFVLAAIYAVTAGAIAWWTAGVPPGAGEAASEAAFARAFGLFMVLLCVVFSGFYAWTGWKVRAARGRWLQTLTALLVLPVPPFFTAFGVYALWVCCLNPSTRALFDAPR